MTRPCNTRPAAEQGQFARTPTPPVLSRLARLVPLTALTLLAWPATALHAEQNPWYVGVSELFSHESNLLRLADGQSAAQVQAAQGLQGVTLSRADNLSQTSLLAGLDQPFGRQRAYANLSVRDTRYARNTLYNNVGYTASGGLDWSTAERVAGSLTYSANRSLSSFNSYGVTNEKNLESTQNADASVRVGLVTQYRLVFTLSHRQSRNSSASQALQAREYQQDAASAGLQWTPRAATTLGLALRETQGRYPKYRQLLDSLNNPVPGAYQADRFKQPALDLTASLLPTGASSLDARLSYSKTRYDLNQQRDFSGLTGTAGWIWQPRDRLKLSARWSRDVGQNSYATTFFSVPGTSDFSQLYNSYRLQGDFNLTAKTVLTGAVQRVDRTLVTTVNNPLIFANALDQSGKDASTVLSLGVRWTPLRSVNVGCDASTERRTASGLSGLTAPLHDNTISCFGQFQLQQ